MEGSGIFRNHFGHSSLSISFSFVQIPDRIALLRLFGSAQTHSKSHGWKSRTWETHVHPWEVVLAAAGIGCFILELERPPRFLNPFNLIVLYIYCAVRTASKATHRRGLSVLVEAVRVIHNLSINSWVLPCLIHVRFTEIIHFLQRWNWSGCTNIDPYSMCFFPTDILFWVHGFVLCGVVWFEIVRTKITSCGVGREAGAGRN